MSTNKINYDSQLEWLFNQFPVFQKVGSTAYKPTLENTEALIDYFGVNLNKLKFVHVAGTNGKGTTASIIASTFTESGLKTGLFTSPHIHDFRERIRVNGEMIGKDEVSEFITLVQNQSFSVKPSFFEISWVMALLHFQKENCEVVVVEAGLGGRLDATNVIKPIISIITNIGLDHTAILGNTLGEIATEKAGIIKHGVPVVIGQRQNEIAHVFQRTAEDLSAQIHFVDQFDQATTFEINERTAREAMKRIELASYEFNSDQFQSAVKHLAKNTGFRGRFQVVNRSPLIITDAAHNEDGIRRLILDVANVYPKKKVHAVYGASDDKELRKIFTLIPDNWSMYFTEFKNKRSYLTDKFKEESVKFSFTSSFFDSPSKALSHVQSLINKDDVIVVFGSFFLLEEII